MWNALSLEMTKKLCFPFLLSLLFLVLCDEENVAEMILLWELSQTCWLGFNIETTFVFCHIFFKQNRPPFMSMQWFCSWSIFSSNLMFSEAKAKANVFQTTTNNWFIAFWCGKSFVYVRCYIYSNVYWWWN